MKNGKKTQQWVGKSGNRYTVNPELNKLAKKVLFPEKVAKMNKLLKGVKLP